jgi:hypothetical protein
MLRLFLLFIFIFTPLVNIKSHALIFGDDDRKNIYEINNERIVNLAQSTGALIRKANLIKVDNTKYKLKGSNLVTQYNLCQDEKFSDELLIANCSFSLIDENQILTAAHCLDKKNIHDFVAVFNYQKKTADQITYFVSVDDVFEIDEQLYYDFDFRSGKDLAVFKLDRKSSRKKLNFNRKPKMKIGDPVFMLGHPYGLPLKLTDNGVITEILPKIDSFRHTLDTFSVNSGSAVFDANTFEVIGVLTRATGHNLKKQSRNCYEWFSGHESSDYSEANFLWKLPNSFNVFK